MHKLAVFCTNRASVVLNRFLYWGLVLIVLFNQLLRNQDLLELFRFPVREIVNAELV